jgi:hypothetical protein
MSQDIAGVYSDARLEYTKQLYTILVPSYFQFFLTMLEKAKVGTEPKKVLNFIATGVMIEGYKEPEGGAKQGTCNHDHSDGSSHDHEHEHNETQEEGGH